MINVVAKKWEPLLEYVLYFERYSDPSQTSTAVSISFGISQVAIGNNSSVYKVKYRASRNNYSKVNISTGIEWKLDFFLLIRIYESK